MNKSLTKDKKVAAAVTVWRVVGSFIITGKQLDKHTMGELEDLIWDRLEAMDEVIDNNFSCEKRMSGITQDEMHNSGLRIRITLETTAEPLNEEEVER